MAIFFTIFKMFMQFAILRIIIDYSVFNKGFNFFVPYSL